MTVIAFGPSLSQKDPALKPGDIDDCWVVASLQAARAVGADISGIDIPTFRKAANRPDDPHHTNPGGAADVIRGATKLWPKLRISQASTNYPTLRAGMVKQGKVAVLLVDSSKLPDELQYGFQGLHAISARFIKTATGGAFYEVNPLQPKGTKAARIPEANMKRALEGYPNGCQAVLFAPAPEVVIPTPPGQPVPPPLTQDDVDAAYAQGRVDGIGEAIDALEALL